MEEVKEMTQMAFIEKMEKAVENFGDDTEICHAYMDDIMVEALESLGFCCLLFKETDKWYA